VPDETQQATWRPLAARAVAEATNGPVGPGPVHLNLAFREPLTGDRGPLPARPAPTVRTSTGGGPDSPALGGRGIVVAGAGATRHPEQLLALGRALGWPVLADPRSGCRLPGTIAAADALVRTERPLPDVVVLLGAPWLSKALAAYIESAAQAGAQVIAVDPWWQWTDPARVVSQFHHGDPDQFIEQALAAAPGEVDGAWLARWVADEARAQDVIDATLGGELNEPAVARLVAGHAAARGVTIVVSASMPMRDLEWYGPALTAPPRILANRGANGIDGVVSTAFGVAASGVPTLALLGDLAFLHDVSGLVNLDPHSPCTLVVLDNGGGGIFSFLPQADALASTRFEQLFGTPPTSDVAVVARGFGLAVCEVDDLDQLSAALERVGGPGPSLIRVRVPSRADNVALHDALNQAVRVAVS
jgi:2-succinyl-5-enolpyruvyl-6-hydroxy-3-cyclohexene-1-carboxylate synthase